MRHRNAVIEKTDGSGLTPPHRSLLWFLFNMRWYAFSDQPMTTLVERYKTILRRKIF
jgi:hypothetical protein